MIYAFRKRPEQPPPQAEPSIFRAHSQPPRTPKTETLRLGPGDTLPGCPCSHCRRLTAERARQAAGISVERFLAGKRRRVCA
jgi:hypothetical protein